MAKKCKTVRNVMLSFRSATKDFFRSSDETVAIFSPQGREQTSASDTIRTLGRHGISIKRREGSMWNRRGGSEFSCGKNWMTIGVEGRDETSMGVNLKKMAAIFILGVYLH